MTEDLKQAVALLPELEKQLANAVENHHGLRVSHKTTQAIIAALRALEPIAAGTHVIVPKEPNEAMIEAGYKKITVRIEYNGNDLKDAYRAMITASQEPKP